MPILIIESQGRRQAGVLMGRVLIGRWPSTAISIDDRAVSRIHAWVGYQDGHYYVADAGSRTGTFVNEQPLHDRYFLADGDQIRIGPALIHYSLDDIPPSNVEVIDLAPRPMARSEGTRGRFMDCGCGAPLWLPQHFSGVGRCRYCGRKVRSSASSFDTNEPPPMPIPPPLPPFMQQKVDKPPGRSKRQEREDLRSDQTDPTPGENPGTGDEHALDFAPEPPTLPTADNTEPQASPFPSQEQDIAAPVVSPTPRQSQKKECGVCHSSITQFDEITVCPSCGLTFHRDCWQENHGCSAYGCPHVGALTPRARPA